MVYLLTAVTKDVSRAFDVLKQGGELGSLLIDALDILEAKFQLVRDDLARYFSAIEVSHFLPLWTLHLTLSPWTMMT